MDIFKYILVFIVCLIIYLIGYEVGSGDLVMVHREYKYLLEEKDSEIKECSDSVGKLSKRLDVIEAYINGGYFGQR